MLQFHPLNIPLPYVGIIEHFLLIKNLLLSPLNIPLPYEDIIAHFLLLLQKFP